MTQENLSPTPEQQLATENPPYEYKSIHGERIEAAISGAIDHQRSLPTWSEASEPLLREYLRTTFDGFLVENTNRISTISGLRIEEHVARKTQPDDPDRPYGKFDAELRKLGARYQFRKAATNTGNLLESGHKTIPDYNASQNSKNKKRRR